MTRNLRLRGVLCAGGPVPEDHGAVRVAHPGELAGVSEAALGQAVDGSRAAATPQDPTRVSTVSCTLRYALYTWSSAMRWPACVPQCDRALERRTSEAKRRPNGGHLPVEFRPASRARKLYLCGHAGL